jgi:hypothetical protein
MAGGSYKKGAQFNLTKRQVASGILFTPRYYDVNVTEYLEDLEVEQVGPHAMFSRVKLDMSTAALSMSSILEIAFWHHGQNLPADDRSAELNGLEEALTNGVDATWTGNVFPSYGGQTRVDVAPALNSPTGLVAASAPSLMFRCRTLFMSCVIGAELTRRGHDEQEWASSRRTSPRSRRSMSWPRDQLGGSVQHGHDHGLESPGRTG